MQCECGCSERGSVELKVSPVQFDNVEVVVKAEFLLSETGTVAGAKDSSRKLHQDETRGKPGQRRVNVFRVKRMNKITFDG